MNAPIWKFCFIKSLAHWSSHSWEFEFIFPLKKRKKKENVLNIYSIQALNKLFNFLLHFSLPMTARWVPYFPILQIKRDKIAHPGWWVAELRFEPLSMVPKDCIFPLSVLLWNNNNICRIHASLLTLLILLLATICWILTKYQAGC